MSEQSRLAGWLVHAALGKTQNTEKSLFNHNALFKADIWRRLRRRLPPQTRRRRRLFRPAFLYSPRVLLRKTASNSLKSARVITFFPSDTTTIPRTKAVPGTVTVENRSNSRLTASTKQPSSKLFCSNFIDFPFPKGSNK